MRLLNRATALVCQKFFVVSFIRLFCKRDLYVVCFDTHLSRGVEVLVGTHSSASEKDSIALETRACA